MEMADKHTDHYFRRWQANIVTTISADVDGELSGVSRCADTGARTPIGVSGNLISYGPLKTHNEVSEPPSIFEPMITVFNQKFLDFSTPP
jgi:hypothetical protein